MIAVATAGAGRVRDSHLRLMAIRRGMALLAAALAVAAGAPGRAAADDYTAPPGVAAAPAPMMRLGGRERDRPRSDDGLTTERRQPINAFAEVHRLDGDQDPHLRGDLDHRGRLQQLSAKATRVAGSPPTRSVIRAPVPSSNSTTDSQVESVAAVGTFTSTKAGVASPPLGVGLKRARNL